ncbi:hypothetical protein PMAYCL1PPCAC_26253, partial [Pristionchus mayeri]
SVHYLHQNMLLLPIFLCIVLFIYGRDSSMLLKVDLPIKIMKRLTDEFIDPEMYKSDAFVHGYKKECKSGHNAPQSILTYLHLRLVKNCRDTITPTEAQALADHRSYLMRVLLRLREVGEDPIPDPGLYLSEFLAIYEHLENKEVLNEDLHVFNRYFTTHRKAVQAFFKELRIRASIETMENDEESCILRALIRTSNFNYPAIEAFALKLEMQLIEVTCIAGICVNVIYRGDARSIDKYTKQIVDNVILISSYTSKWLNDSLISAWPSAHNEILREHIMRVARQPGYVDNRNLNTVTDFAHPLLINTGLPNHVYEMLIVRAADAEYEHYFEVLLIRGYLVLIRSSVAYLLTLRMCRRQVIT